MESTKDYGASAKNTDGRLSYRLWRRVGAAVAFAVAFATYLLTLEPTASFWDCPEFIACADKLDVGHPPGAPFFMLAGKFATLFAANAGQVARMVNGLSALFSALTILFLYLTIAHIAERIVSPKNIKPQTLGEQIGVIGASLVGALVYTFSDTFWFSAVEAEVYAFSSLFTAVVFWGILKWESTLDEGKSADKWLVLIAYMMGLSISVHLLNLLAIPAIVLVFYFRQYAPTWKGTLGAIVVSGIILFVVLFGFIPGSIEVAGWFDLAAVNGLGLGYNSGAAVYFALTLGALVWAIREVYADKSRWRMGVSMFVASILLGIPFVGNGYIAPVIIIGLLAFYLLYRTPSARVMGLIALSSAMFFVGYSCYVVTIVRALSNPAMSQNQPDNVFALKTYMGREQYGETPLIYGPNYAAEMKIKVDGNGMATYDFGKTTYWAKDRFSDKPHYKKFERRVPKYESQFMTLFPRMYSPQVDHIEQYKAWAGEGRAMRYERLGETEMKTVPTFGENLAFFVRYQLNFMYWRYFMWNFSGRLNDIQGLGEPDHGRWITGFDFIDSVLIGGDMKNLPPDLADNKGRNAYYMLPFLLGLLGIGYQLRGKFSLKNRGTQSFIVVMTLFVLTGIAIVVYLNQTPMQPRERDYAYAGSFYAYAIWVGLGVLGLYEAVCALVKSERGRAVGSAVAVVVALGVPTLMAAQNWDDHDRSDRRTCADFGYDYLASCEPNAIIFTYGDNDTFPLWYLQEVEGVRTDVRVCNLSYLNTDWYIDQMRRPYHQSAALPINLNPEQYAEGVRDVGYVNTDRAPIPGLERYAAQAVDLGTALDLYYSDDTRMKDLGENFFISQHLYLPVDKEVVARNKSLVGKAAADDIADTIDITLGSRVYKNEAMILQLLRDNKDWERPIYYATTVGSEANLGLQDYMRNEGLARRIVPVKQQRDRDGKVIGVDTGKSYENLMHQFRWGGIENPKVYLDENNMRMCHNMRRHFIRLAEALIEEGDSVRAREVLDKAQEVIPTRTVYSTHLNTQLAEAYYRIGETAKGDAVLTEVADKAVKSLAWYAGMDKADYKACLYSVGEYLIVLQEACNLGMDYERPEIVERYDTAFREQYALYMRNGR